MPVPKPSFPALQPHGQEPIYRQIYVRFRHAIAAQMLKPGDRIPAARALALELGVARGTVDAAYALLTAEGYLQPRGPAGTIVAPDLQAHAAGSSSANRHGTQAPQQINATGPLPFQMGLPALDAFPRKIWARLAARAARATSQEDMLYPPPAGLPSLRREIATYLQLSRGVHCAPEQVLITSGYRETLQLISAALLQPGQQVWVEDPGYPPTTQLLAQAGMRAVPVAVDADGLQVAQGVALAPQAAAAVVTPAHQSPLCVALSLQRRLALLDWAAHTQAWIIEDDYDGEYRYQGRPLPALKSLDRAERVLYAGTFSKVLFPGVRLAYLVVPIQQLPAFLAADKAIHSGAPVLTQHIVSAFMAEGHFGRHLQRMRKLYGERRQIAAQVLEQLLGKHLHVEPQPGGMHLILRLHGRRSDRILAQRMRAAGMAVHALSERSSGASTDAGLLLGFTNVDSPATAARLAARIQALLT